MTSVLSIVTRAFRKIRVSGAGETLTADDLEDGVTALNQMMHGWKLRGVDLEHTDLVASDDFSLSPEFEEGTVYMLASRLSPDFARPQDFDADDWFRGIQTAYAPAHVVTMPTMLLRTPTGRRYNSGNS